MSPAPLSSELLILRHGKSDWDSGAASDFDRPLARRGRRAVDRIAQWISEQGLVPDRIVTSSAARALETARRVAAALDLAEGDIEAHDDLYLAGGDTFLERGLMALDGCERVLVVGHNPGMEELVVSLSGGAATPAANGKVFPTAALAVFAFDPQESDTQQPDPETARLRHLIRPREL